MPHRAMVVTMKKEIICNDGKCMDLYVPTDTNSLRELIGGCKHE